jgi:hypothetical protein
MRTVGNKVEGSAVGNGRCEGARSVGVVGLVGGGASVRRVLDRRDLLLSPCARQAMGRARGKFCDVDVAVGEKERRVLLLLLLLLLVSDVSSAWPRRCEGGG